MEIEVTPPGISPSQEDPFREQTPPIEGPPMVSAPPLDIERIVERVLGRLGSQNVAVGPPAPSPRPPPAGEGVPWSRVVGRKAK